MSTSASPAQTFRMIPLSQIKPSPMNPRKRFDEAPLKELAASIKQHGVRQPILVRPDGNKKDAFEIVVGERRFRASKLAGATEIPALVDPYLSNASALEIMVIENLQREDIHPLDEALGYEALMKKPSDPDPELGDLPGAPRHTAESIAAKVGKSAGYVYARLKLLSLIGAARDAFEQDLITPGHAVLVARLQPIDQIRALDACFHRYGNDRELKKLDPAKLKLKDLHIEEDHGLLPEKTLREWIQENVNLKLKGVPWKLDDAYLLPEAGPCTTCPKRSASNPGLFADLAVKDEDTCFDAACFQEKRKAFVQVTIQADKAIAKSKEQDGDPTETLLQLSELSAYTKPKPDQATYRAGQWLDAKKDSCINTREGIFVRGEKQGKRQYVCIDQSCKVHKHNLRAERQSSGGGVQQDYEREQFKRHKTEVTEKKKAIARAVLVREIVGEVGPKLPIELLRLLAQDSIRVEGRARFLLNLAGIPSDKPDVKLKDLLEGGTETILFKLLIANLFDDFRRGDDAKLRKELSAAAKIVKVKAAKILADADAAIAKQKSCRACGCTEQSACEYWDGSKHVRCSWVKDQDLCSNPACKKYDPKAQTSAKPERKKKH